MTYGQNEWKALEASRSGGSSKVDWSLRSKLKGCDPYLVWFDLTSAESRKSRSLGNSFTTSLDQTADLVAVLIERAEVSGCVAPIPTDDGLALAPTHWHDATEDSKNRVRSYLVPRNHLEKLVELVGKGKIRRFELSHPRQGSAFEFLKALRVSSDKSQRDALFQSLLDLGFTASLLGPFFSTPILKLKLGATHPSETQRDEHKDRRVAREMLPMVAVIDDLCPFASPRLIGADGMSAVRYLWDQGIKEEELHRRRDLGADQTDQFKSPKPSVTVQNGKQAIASPAEQGFEMAFPRQTLKGEPREEAETYRRSGYVTSLRNWGHGTVVTDLIVAASDPARPPDMIWVQLPDATVGDTAGGSLAAHALDGIHYALDRAGDRSLVVNLSYGTHAGPHDGSSMFEVGLRSLLDCYPNLHVVLPAGNSHLMRTHSGACIPAGGRQHLRWKVLADDPTDSYLEVWVPSGSEVCISVTPPQGETVTVTQGSGRVWVASDKTVRAAVIFPDAVAQGKRGTMCLIALSPTRRTVDSISKVGETTRLPLEAPHGIWHIQLVNLTEQPVTFDAWIQRDDSAPGRGPRSRGQMGRQSYFLDAAEDCTDPRSTLNGIATLEPHPRLRVVGAMRASDLGVSLYSSSGPNRGVEFRATGPDVVATADHSLNLPGLLVGGVLASSRLRVGGSSIAAAVVSGMLYRHLAEGRPAETFYFYPVQHEGRQPIGATGSPERAEDLRRGDWERIERSDAQIESAILGAAAAGLSYLASQAA